MSCSETVVTFAKGHGCPSANELIQATGSSLQSWKRIASHLVVCDFCAAEAHFLSSHTAQPAPYELADMPRHLRKLAEALLVRQGFEFGN